MSKSMRMTKKPLTLAQARKNLLEKQAANKAAAKLANKLFDKACKLPSGSREAKLAFKEYEVNTSRAYYEFAKASKEMQKLLSKHIQPYIKGTCIRASFERW